MAIGISEHMQYDIRNIGNEHVPHESIYIILNVVINNNVYVICSNMIKMVIKYRKETHAVCTVKNMSIYPYRLTSNRVVIYVD